MSRNCTSLICKIRLVIRGRHNRVGEWIDVPRRRFETGDVLTSNALLQVCNRPGLVSMRCIHAFSCLVCSEPLLGMVERKYPPQSYVLDLL